MKDIFKPLVLILLLCTIVVGTIFVVLPDNTPPPPFKSHTNEQLLHERLDSLQSEKEAIRQQRDSLYRDIAVLYSRHAADSVRIKELDKKLSEIPGRYKDVDADSLGKLMDQRADAGLDR